MNIKYDLIVVGTGFASSFFLKTYLETAPSHAKVLVLERGIFFPHIERLKHAKGEESGLATKVENVFESIKNDNSKKDWGFNISMGGGSNCWTGCTPRFMPNDFQLKTKYGVGTDWPLSYQDLEKYYCDAEEIMAIAGPEDMPYPMSRKYPLPPHHLSTVDRILQKEYGNLYVSQPTARASASVGIRRPCCSSGVCDLCPVNSKFTIENTLFHIYEDPRVQIRYNVNVYSLQLQNDFVKSVILKSNGRNEEIEGEIIALGTNAIFNAHILLNAGDKNKFTGTGLSEQIGISSFLYLKNLDNVGGASYISANGFMLADGDHRKDHGAILIENHNYPFVRNEFGKWRHIAKFKFVIEDLPDENHKVLTTNNELLPEVVYKRHTDYAQRSLDKLRSYTEKIFSVLPVEGIETDIDIQRTEYHICSTTRMSDNAQNGVIDKNLIHHQYRNLFVLGSGSFPTISASNPTLTIAALSLRAAEKGFKNVHI